MDTTIEGAVEIIQAERTEVETRILAMLRALEAKTSMKVKYLHIYASANSEESISKVRITLEMP
jgi:hypothetical protein